MFETVATAIDAYTGLTPAAFVTILALMIGAYHLVSAFFVSPQEERGKPTRATDQLATAAPPAEPVQIGDVTSEELRAYDGSDPAKPLLMAIKGQIYDVTRSRMFYGPGGPYALFAGRETSRALALMSFDQSDLTGNLDGLSEAELEVLHDWEEKFKEKYLQVGQVVSEKSINKNIDCSTVKTDGDQAPQSNANI